MISFPIIFKIFYRVARFAHLLRMFSCFYPHFPIKSENKKQWHFVGLHNSSGNPFCPML